MPSHRAPSPRHRASRALVRAAVALGAAGTALASGAAVAQAASPAQAVSPAQAASPESEVSGALGGATQALDDGIAPATHLRLNPMAGTTVNPLTNAVGTKIADFKPIGTQALTGPLAQGDSISQLPLVGPLTSHLFGS